MRLFIAIDFPKYVKKFLETQIIALQKCHIQGSFVRKENLHLTMFFIGDTKKEKDIILSLQNIEYAPFEIILEEMGMFYRSYGNILWTGVRENIELSMLHKDISNAMKELDFKVDNRPFAPHITMGRKVIVPDMDIFKNLAQNIPLVSVPVDALTLFKSHYVQGVLTYTPVFIKQLNKKEPL